MGMKLVPSALSAAARAERKRTRLARQAPPGALHDYLATPLDGLRTPLSQARILAVDLETTGLDPARDLVLSIGFVPIDGLSIRLGGAGGSIVCPPSRGVDAGRGPGQSAAVHGLTDDVVAAGVPLREALEQVLVALRGRVLVAHFVSIERDFLAAACRRLHGVDLPLTMIDTLELQRLIVAGPEGHVRGGALRLAAAREHFGLPRYRAHDAVTDALACAELYLAQVAHLGRRGEAPLSHVLE